MRSEEKEEEGEEEEKEEKEEIVERGRAEDCSYHHILTLLCTWHGHKRHARARARTHTHTHNGNREACGGLQRTAHTDSAAVRQTQTGCSHRPACCLKLMMVSGC